jgi:hypothetical protein
MIRQYIGRLGQGKTTMMIYDAWRYLISPPGKYKIITNQPINIKIGKKLYSYPPTERDDLVNHFMEDYNTLFLIDEIHLLFPSYDRKYLTTDLQARLSYMRKYGNALLYTSQGYNHVHKRLRDITNEVAKVKKTKFSMIFKHIATYYDPEGMNMASGIIDPYDDKYVIFRRYAWRWTINKIYNSFNTTYTTTTDKMVGEFIQPDKLGVKLGMYNGI